MSFLIPEYSFELDVHIFDTDCYGVMWHGAYIKWLEMGRVDLFKSIGIDMKTFSDAHDIIFPVVEQNLRFRSPARHNDALRLTTTVEVENFKLIFNQKFLQQQSGKLVVEAVTTVVLINTEGQLYRTLPEVFIKKLPQPMYS